MMQLSRFPRARLAHLPTPLEPLQALTAHLQGPQVYIKRDDCTGLAFGGNKTRKLEYLLGEAQALGATTIFSEGGLQSNHVRQTAAAAARLGLKCELVLSRNVPGRPQDYEVTGNIFIDRLLNARIHVCEPGEDRSARMAAENSRLPESVLEVTDSLPVVEALVERYAALAASTRAAIEAAEDQHDVATADLFTEVTRGLDKDLWFLEAHLQ